MSFDYQLLWRLGGKASVCQCRRHRFDPWVGKIPWRKKWQSTPVFLPGKSYGQRSLVSYSPWGWKRARYDLATKKQSFDYTHLKHNSSLIQMINKKMKRYSSLLTIREIQIKTMMRYHLTPIRTVIVIKSTNNKCWRMCGEKRILLYCCCCCC